MLCVLAKAPQIQSSQWMDKLQRATTVAYYSSHLWVPPKRRLTDETTTTTDHLLKTFVFYSRLLIRLFGQKSSMNDRTAARIYLKRWKNHKASRFIMEELPKKIIYETTIVCRMYLLSLGLVKDYTISQLTLDAVVSNAMADLFLTILSEDSRTTGSAVCVLSKIIILYASLLWVQCNGWYMCIYLRESFP